MKLMRLGMTGLSGRMAGAGVALAALGMALSPAIGAVDTLLKLRADNPVSLHELGSIYSFTPSTQDQRLAAAYAKAVLSRSSHSFRFTPTSGSMDGRRSITVLVRAADLGRGDRTSPVSLTPLAFNLDASRGWRKFALSDAAGRKPLDPLVTDLAGARGYSLASGRPRAGDNLGRASDTVANPLLPGTQQYEVDLGKSYRLTRSLDVTAGVRYGRSDPRLNPMTDQRKDNQAVYVGTVVKF